MRITRGVWIALACAFLCGAPACAGAVTSARPSSHGIVLVQGNDTIALQLVAPNVLRVQLQRPGAPPAPPRGVLDPAHPPRALASSEVRETPQAIELISDRIQVRWDKHAARLTVGDATQHALLWQSDFGALLNGRIVLGHAATDPLYGIHGYYATEPSAAGLLRSGVQVAKAGEQGDAGAPFVWSTRGYGVLVDARPARFVLDGASLSVDGFPAGGTDYYLIVGPPSAIFAALSRLSGPAPLFPKWAMGFTNSQWGIDEQELLAIVDGYRRRRIPIDNITLDFDWKAWGQDDYGEFRWNTDKFPDGPSGKLKHLLDARGIHLTGILKPRIHLDTVQGRYATEHGLWYEGKPAIADYFSHQPVRDLDFDKPAARAWFFNDALKHSFDTGIVGWWNDEADDTGDDTQFMNMERALYEGQRAYSPLRVWSINRNFYLGAQRYAYGLWSGDIDTGFDSMASQRERMLSAIALGEWKWGMDGGGFKGHPSNENYARWIEFGAFTPIFRVHGSLDEKRQPWRYGPLAEAAATRAIRLRYRLIPYIYAYEHALYEHGVGLVRPLAFAFPHDPAVRNDVDAWMFGQWLLVAPVVQQGQTRKRIYLPAGRWIDYFSGAVYAGGRAIDYPIDSARWSDIPLFVRAGAIIPTQPLEQYVGERPLTTLEVDAFPTGSASSFAYYDDDGTSYRYEHGHYFAQTLTTQTSGTTVRFALDRPRGSYRPALQRYLVRLHVAAATTATLDGKALPRAQDLDALRASAGAGWSSGTDRFGPVTYLALPAGRALQVQLHVSGPARPAVAALARASGALLAHPHVARPTPPQLAQLVQVLDPDSPAVPASLRPAWRRAETRMSEVLLFLSCYPDWDAWSYLRRYQVPATGHATYYLAPMNATRFHDPSRCLTLRRLTSVQGGADTLSFRVLFVADDTGESADRTFGMARQPDGGWLFARAGF